MRTVVVSDLHIGAGNFERKRFFTFLESIKGGRLILNGDVLDSPSPRVLGRRKPRQALRQLEAFAKNTETILLLGNHDYDARWPETERLLPSLLGLPPRPKAYVHNNYLITHGDTFDPWLNFNLLSTLADGVYQVAQKVSHEAARLLKKSAKHFGGVISKLAKDAATYAKRGGYRGVILGHTHHADDLYTQDGLHYLNTGCWTEPPGTYIEFEEEDSVPGLREFKM